MTTFLLIRHGTNDFTGKRLIGRRPGVHLNAAGQRQAELLAETLKALPIRAIYSSPLERAVETAEPLAAVLGLPVQIRPELMEVDFGVWVGKTSKQMKRTRLWKSIQEQPSEVQFPDGESFTAAQARVRAELDALSALHDDEDIAAVFSHADVIRLAAASYLGLPLDNFQRLGLEPASITTLQLPKEGPPYLQMINTVIGREFKLPAEEKPARTPKVIES